MSRVDALCWHRLHRGGCHQQLTSLLFFSDCVLLTSCYDSIVSCFIVGLPPPPSSRTNVSRWEESSSTKFELACDRKESVKLPRRMSVRPALICAASASSHCLFWLRTTKSYVSVYELWYGFNEWGVEQHFVRDEGEITQWLTRWANSWFIHITVEHENAHTFVFCQFLFILYKSVIQWKPDYFYSWCSFCALLMS